MKRLRPAHKEDSESPPFEPPGSAQDHDFSGSMPGSSAHPAKKEEPVKKDERLSPFPSLMDVNSETKTEQPDASSPSQSPTLNDNEMTPQKFKVSPTPTPPPSTTNGTTSMASTPPPIPPPSSVSNSKKSQVSALQLIGDLPIARNEALATFNEIAENNYQYKTLGRSREVLESMTCDCNYEHGVDSTDDACGPDSDCINRLTQVECLPDDCRCRDFCQNQRFQRLDYADIEIVQTEKKGYGLRAESDVRKDAFIYEYVGDVVNPISFKKRMRDYAAEGIQHFYFMMLQKDEFIDATKSGGIGRFANHSCKPNCYVAKWTVGSHVRMGIFAKRNIKQFEELTFNYNVDRYGHQAQTCYCGEPNCVGFIGGKTQTDIVTMDDLYLDALGITDEADLLELKGSKKKKGKKIDDPDFMPTMKPIVEKDVPKVVQAIRQTQSRKVLYKLLTRIKITEDQAALRQIMRLRGYSLMTNILEDHSTDLELIVLALECMATWPLLNRNKVEDSKVTIPVQACTELDNLAVREMAKSLLEHWAALPLYNRIPKRIKRDGDDDDTSTALAPIYQHEEEETRTFKRIKYREQRLQLPKFIPQDRTDHWPSSPVVLTPTLPPVPVKPRGISSHFSRESVQAIIAAAAEATAAEEAAAAEAAAAAAALAESKAATSTSNSRKKSKPPKKHQTPEEKEANKEKRLLKLVGAVVVKCMSKYSKSMDHDLFKKHAKELTQLIADKEKKSSSYKDGKLDTLSDEKVTKIKKFAKEYIAKIVRKLEKSGKRHRHSSAITEQATPSTSMDTPNSTDGISAAMPDMSVEEAMDMEPDSESDGDDDMPPMENGNGAVEHTDSDLPGPLSLVLLEPEGVAGNESMDIDELDVQPLDPRRRPPEKEHGWEPHKQGLGVWAAS